MSGTRKHLKVKARFYRHEDGGRRRPPRELSSQMYRPHLVVGDSDMMGVVFLEGPREVEADVSFEAVVQCLYEAVDYTPLVEGAAFTIREGGRAVGDGIILAAPPDQDQGSADSLNDDER